MKKIILVIILLVTHLLCLGLGYRIGSVHFIPEQAQMETVPNTETVDRETTEEAVDDMIPETEMETVAETVNEEIEMTTEETEPLAPAPSETQPAVTDPPATQPPATNPPAPQPPEYDNNRTPDDEL